jgi:hypothetical protein
METGVGEVRVIVRLGAERMSSPKVTEFLEAEDDRVIQE